MCMSERTALFPAVLGAGDFPSFVLKVRHLPPEQRMGVGKIILADLDLTDITAANTTQLATYVPNMSLVKFTPATRCKLPADQQAKVLRALLDSNAIFKILLDRSSTPDRDDHLISLLTEAIRPDPLRLVNLLACRCIWTCDSRTVGATILSVWEKLGYVDLPSFAVTTSINTHDLALQGFFD